MATQWVQTNFSGVRFREHPTRKHGVQRDKYFVLRFRVDGKRHEEALGWASEGWTAQKAALQLAKLKEAQRLGEGPSTLAEKRTETRKVREAEAKASISFESYFSDRYLPEASTRKKPKTISVEQQHLRDWLAPVFKGKPMREITPDDLEAVKARILKAKRTFRTVQHVLANFRLVWNHAAKKGRVEGLCPARAVEIPRIQNARTRFLSGNDIAALLAEVRKRDGSAYELTLAAIYTGARLGELAALTWAGVNLEDGVLTLLHTKTAKPRTVPLAAPLRAVLSAREPGQAGDRVFLDSRGNPWREMPWAFRAAVEDMGLNEGRERKDRVCFHSLRHSAATAMLAAGVDVRSLQSIFGWSTLAMAGRYSHAVNEAKARAVAALEAALTPKKGKVVDINRARAEGAA